MKVKCKKCNRNVGTTLVFNGDRLYNKHRTGRSTPKNVKPVCEKSGKDAHVPLQHSW